jgi:AbrB family looped-hinge helix DNA binding protein
MDERLPKSRITERLLTQPTGATMREIMAVTGGPQYNELKRLAARGYTIRKVKDGNETRYFAAPPAAPSFEATVTSKGQVTIPKEVRERLGARAGRKVRFAVENGDRVVITPIATKLSDLAGMLGKPRRSATLEQMDEAIGRAIIDRYLRAVGKKR